MTIIGTKYNEERDIVTTCKMIRKDLKAAYPGQKFKVKLNRYAGGRSIYITAPEGVNKREVEALGNEYNYRNIDHSTDYYNVDFSLFVY